MSNEAQVSADDFKLVKYKKKSPNSSKCNKIDVEKSRHYTAAASALNKETVVRRIQEARSELLESDVFASFVASLREGLAVLDKPVISEIVCFGLGRLGECLISRYQFGLLLCLRELYDVPVAVFDPIFTDAERAILEYFDCTILDCNVEGKYRVKDQRTTLFYLPHCPKQLTNNLLWANWGLDLNYCVVVANSFHRIIESCSRHVLKANAEYVSLITPYVLELAVVNNFRFFEVFNDTAIHVFPGCKLNLLPGDLWRFCPEPNYAEDDLEFVRTKP